MNKAQTVKHDFLCVGFAKCGTTTLQQIFKNHRDIYLPAIKETYLYFSKGYDWYLNRYYDKHITKKAVGEFNPCYTMAVNTRSTDSIARQIHQDFGPDIKLIFLLRNPVGKLFSWYKYALPYGWIYKNPADNLVPSIGAGFDQYVLSQFRYDQGQGRVLLDMGENPRTHYPLEGEYGKYIQSFLQFFPRENMKFFLFEEFIRDMETHCGEIMDFIGVEPDPNLDYNVAANEGKRAPKSARSIWCMKALSLLRHWYNKYVPYLGYGVDRAAMALENKIECCLTKSLTDHSQMAPATRRLLEEFYRKDKEAVEQLLGRDLSALWYP
ncbi:MAG: sulfotransferase domain-containing protein [Oscillospiraceae bacterium]|nr:sulfotransferase domain-containing protein [Oscillospiraceae bacterium]